MNSRGLLIANVAIPCHWGDEFIPALDLKTAFDYYPEFIRFSGQDWPFQGYVSAILKRIDEDKPNGFYGSRSIGDFMRHWGIVELQRAVNELVPDMMTPVFDDCHPLKSFPAK